MFSDVVGAAVGLCTNSLASCDGGNGCGVCCVAVAEKFRIENAASHAPVGL